MEFIDDGSSTFRSALTSKVQECQPGELSIFLLDGTRIHVSGQVYIGKDYIEFSASGEAGGTLFAVPFGQISHMAF